jgi:hypothetical protein
MMVMINRDELYTKVKENIDRYLNLDILDQKVRCPFGMNKVEQEFLTFMEKTGVSEDKIVKVHMLYKENKGKYGWYRGKGTPEEIENAFLELCKLQTISVKNPTPDGIREIMKLLGMGIDCSGFVYNVLLPAFEALDMKDSFMNSLAWGDKEYTGVSRASVDIFAGRASITIKDLKLLNGLDLVFIKDIDGSYIHMGIILKEKKQLQVVQATLTVLPNGVRIDGMELDGNRPIFNIKRSIGEDWNSLYQNGQIEFRRLRILNEIH